MPWPSTSVRRRPCSAQRTACTSSGASKAAATTPARRRKSWDAADSDQYRSLFTLANGEALSFLHGDMTQYRNGQLHQAGAQIGVVAPNGDPNAPNTYWGTAGSGHRVGYNSTPDIVEFGLYQNARDAFSRNSGGDLNPYSYLAGLGSGGAAVIQVAPIDINVHRPDGTRQRLRVQPKIKYNGMAGVNVASTQLRRGTVAHPARRFPEPLSGAPGGGLGGHGAISYGGSRYVS